MRGLASLSGTGFAVIPTDYRQRPPNIQLDVEVPAGGATYSVLYTNDDILSVTSNVIPTSITRVTTTATVVSPLHGLNTGDLVWVFNTGYPNFQATSLDGGPFAITVTDQNTFTYAVANSGVTTGYQFSYYIGAHVFPAAALTAQTTRKDGNIAFPCSAVILNVTAYTGPGPVLMQVTQGPSSA